MAARCGLLAVGRRHLLNVHGHVSSEHTAWVFEPILRWMIPSLTADQFETVHHVIRKSAHFTEYFVFCLLLYRGVRGDRKGCAGCGRGSTSAAPGIFRPG